MTGCMRTRSAPQATSLSSIQTEPVHEMMAARSCGEGEHAAAAASSSRNCAERRPLRSVPSDNWSIAPARTRNGRMLYACVRMPRVRLRATGTAP